MSDGATEDAIRHVPQVASSVTLPNFDAQNWPMGDRKATAHLPRAKQKALDALTEKAFEGGQWAVIVPSHNEVIVRRGFDAGGRSKFAKFSADVLAAIQ